MWVGGIVISSRDYTENVYLQTMKKTNLTYHVCMVGHLNYYHSNTWQPCIKLVECLALLGWWTGGGGGVEERVNPLHKTRVVIRACG